MPYGRDEDTGFDRFLEEQYEERYELPDYEEFELRQLDLDREYDEYYDEDVDEDDGFYDSDEYDDPA